jgi:signal transduction histidine kinase/ActR/RegA family two-component response regulator
MSSIDLARAFGVGAAGEHPLLRLPRSWRHRRAGTAFVGAVSGVSVLVLAVLGVVPTLPGLAVVAAFGLGLLAARLTSRSSRERAEAATLGGHHAPLFDHLPVGTLVMRASDLELVYMSPEVERLLGVSRTTTHTLDDLLSARVHELDRERVLGAWQSWLSGRRSEPFRAGYRLVGADGRVVCVEDVTFLVVEDDDGPPTLRRHLLDRTRQRQLEEQLRQAQRLELLGRLAAGVAHDFNNLLAVITGYATRLSAPLPRHARDESTHAITAAAERGASLVRQLLAFSRPQSTDSRVVDLNDLVREFAPLLRRVIGEDLEFRLRLDSHRLPVEVHPVQIDQVLMNIAVNARDAMPDGGRLTISTWKLDGTASVTVSDTGVGMDAATQDRIFEPFFSTKEPGKGSGLGLSTAYGIMRHAGGSLTVSSVPGDGTTFSINLPLASNDVPSFLDATVDPAAPDGGPETVLVVEDEPALRELESLMLEDAGYHVLTAANAAEALVVAAENVIDLLVVDVVMPGMSGPQLVEELAARDSDVPTVFVSGYGAHEISNRGLETGKTALIEKPFQAEVFLRRVRDVLDGVRAEPRASAGERSR